MRQTFYFITQYPLRNEVKIFGPTACLLRVFCLLPASQSSDYLAQGGKQSLFLLMLLCVFLFLPVVPCTRK
jgi:hypothetical protein